MPAGVCFMSEDGTGNVKWWVSGIVGPIIVGLAIWYLTGPNSPFDHHKPAAHTSSAYGTINMPAGYNANVYNNPSLNAIVVAEIGNGQTVQIRCTIQGQVVTDNGQSSSLWDYIGGGYLPDVNIFTNTNQPVAPNC
jgi:hypothetical protein